MSPVWIGAECDGSGGNNWSYNTCKAPVKSSPTNQHPANFYTPDAVTCRPTNSVGALKGKVSHSMDALAHLESYNLVFVH